MYDVQSTNNKTTQPSQLNDLKEFLDLKHAQYNNPAFIESDPVVIPHNFTAKEDLEITGSSSTGPSQ